MLCRKLLLAVPERNRQRAAHMEFTAMLPNTRFETEWTALVKTWEKNHDALNPYMVATTCESFLGFLVFGS